MPTELKLYNIRKWKWKVKPKSVSVIKWVRNCGNPRLRAIISRSIHLSTSTDKETAPEIILASDYLSIDWAYIQPTDSYVSIILSIRLYRKSSKWNLVDCIQSIYLLILPSRGSELVRTSFSTRFFIRVLVIEHPIFFHLFFRRLIVISATSKKVGLYSTRENCWQNCIELKKDNFNKSYTLYLSCSCFWKTSNYQK